MKALDVFAPERPRENGIVETLSLEGYTSVTNQEYFRVCGYEYRNVSGFAPSAASLVGRPRGFTYSFV